ncbi:Uncharacterised protein [Bordetella pertussis]|nr:Uncharacterised protein [Bordetella pertussis]
MSCAKASSARLQPSERWARAAEREGMRFSR